MDFHIAQKYHIPDWDIQSVFPTGKERDQINGNIYQVQILKLLNFRMPTLKIILKSKLCRGKYISYTSYFKYILLVSSITYVM